MFSFIGLLLARLLVALSFCAVGVDYESIEGIGCNDEDDNEEDDNAVFFCYLLIYLFVFFTKISKRNIHPSKKKRGGMRFAPNVNGRTTCVINRYMGGTNTGLLVCNTDKCISFDILLPLSPSFLL